MIFKSKLKTCCYKLIETTTNTQEKTKHAITTV
jgi:hypothetical protein